MWPKEIKTYLHSDKETMWELAKQLGLEGEAIRQFQYALYEVEFTLLVNQDGTYIVVEIDKRPLK